MEVASPTLVNAITVYRPCDEGARLRPSGEHRDDAVAIGEGPVGRAWQDAVPAFETHESGATVAVPCLSGQECRGVVAFECSSDDDLRGAFELWLRNDRGELALADGWYSNLDRLKQITEFVKFPRRAGLPGRVWDDRFPRVLGALTESKQFIRVAAARSEQLNSALGMPFMQSPPVLDGVLLILNHNRTPIAKAMEVWARDLDSGKLRVVSADYGPYVGLASASRALSLGRGDGIAGKVFEDRAPWTTSDLLGKEFPRGEKFVEYGFERGVGIPVFIGSDLVASVNLYL